MKRARLVGVGRAAGDLADGDVATAVEGVADDRVADVRHVDAELVGPGRLRPPLR